MNLRREKKYFAYTLSEILIVISILGVISAITIPNVLKNSQESRYVSKILKNYTLINNVIDQVFILDDPLTWDRKTKDSVQGATNICNNMRPYFRAVTECTVGNKGILGTSYKTLSGKSSWYTPSNNVGFKLKDGTSITFWSPGNDQTSSMFCTSADINGPDEPNKIGVDFFEVCVLKKNNRITIYDREDDKTLCDFRSSNTDRYNGRSCIHWILRHKNMKYLHHDVSAEW